MKKIISGITIISFSLLTLSCNNKKGTSTTSSIPKSKVENIESIEQIDTTGQKKRYLRTLSLRNQFCGKNITKIRSKYDFGNVETLTNTDASFWVTYFKKYDITVLVKKQNDKILNVIDGKYPNLVFDSSYDLSKIINKELSFEDYTKSISSLRFGSIEKLSKIVCINKDCIEYFPKGDFTTVSYKKFDDKGDFVTLKKIAQGRVPYLDSYETKNLKKFEIKIPTSNAKPMYPSTVTEDKEYKKLVSSSKKLGVWYIEHKNVKSMNWHYEIYKKGSKYYGVMITKSPSIETLKKNGEIYKILNNKHGEYYKLKGSKFKMYDSSGEITDYKITFLD